MSSRKQNGYDGTENYTGTPIAVPKISFDNSVSGASNGYKTPSKDNLDDLNWSSDLSSHLSNRRLTSSPAKSSPSTKNPSLNKNGCIGFVDEDTDDDEEITDGNDESVTSDDNKSFH
jgi:hypothetical protein